MIKSKQFDNHEEQLHKLSQEFLYPATPDITRAVAQGLQRKVKPAPSLSSRLVLGVVAIVLLVAALMAMPAVRARVLNWLQIGSIRIFFAESTTTVTHLPTQSPTPSGQMDQVVVPNAQITPSPTARPFPFISELVGETSLEEAQNQIVFPIRLPAYPTDLGSPDLVFLQDLGGQAILLVWMESNEPEQIRLTLLLMGSGTFGEKFEPPVVEETTVNGQRAVWTEGPHYLQLGSRTYANVPLVVNGNVLIWVVDGITYRLETDLPLDEAVRIAESMEIIQPGNQTNSDVYLALENCPVTQPQDLAFTPPSPHLSKPPYEDYFWYGTENLWTMLPINGNWEYFREWDPYVQKIFWMNKDYDARTEPRPEFTVKARRLDGPAQIYESTEATNTFDTGFGDAILTGIEMSSLGCWEFTGSYREYELNFVVLVSVKP